MIRSSACQPWQPDLPGHAGDRGDLLSYTTPRDTILAGPSFHVRNEAEGDFPPPSILTASRPRQHLYRWRGFLVQTRANRYTHPQPGTATLGHTSRPPNPGRGENLTGGFQPPFFFPYGGSENERLRKSF